MDIWILMLQLMSLVFYARTGGESIYGGKFAGQLAHVFQNIFSLNNLIYIVRIVLNIPYFLSHIRIFSYVMMALVFYQWPMLARTPMVLTSLLLFRQHLILMGIYLIPYLECHLWFFVFTWFCVRKFTCWLWSTYFLFIHDSWVSPYGNFVF